MKKIWLLMAALSMMFIFPISSFAAEDALTVETYRHFLQKESPEDLKKFETLDGKEQEQFIAYLLDPATYGSEKSAADGTRCVNCEGVSQVIPESWAEAAGVTVRRAYGIRKVKLFGISVLECRLEVTYRMLGKRITEIDSSEAYVMKNLSPVAHISAEGKDAYISGNAACGRGTFHYTLRMGKDSPDSSGKIRGELSVRANGSMRVSFGKNERNVWYS